MNYEHMSDLEINGLIALRLGGCKGAAGEHMPNGVKALEVISGMEFYTERDYCNNPQDTDILIEDYGISLIKMRDGWQAVGPDWSWIDINTDDRINDLCIGDDVEKYGHECKGRAVAVCFLMMQEAK